MADAVDLGLDVTTGIRGGVLIANAAVDKLKEAAKGTRAEKAAESLATFSSKLTTITTITTAIVLQVGAITSAILRQDILAATDLVLQFVQANQNTLREVGLMKGTVLSIKDAVSKAPGHIDDDVAALQALLTNLKDAQGLLEEIASQRSRVYGLFLTAPYTTRLTRLRTEMFNNVHVLTLAYVIRLGGNDGSLAAGSTSRLFDATRFLSCTDAQEFWLTHAGITTRRLAWIDFVEAMEYDFGKQDHRFLALLQSRLVEDTTVTAKDASVSVYQLAKFTTNATFRTAILRLQQEFYWIIFGPYVERLMAFTLAENSLGLRVDKEIADSCFIPVPEQAQALVDGYAELLARFSTWLAEPEALTVSSLYTDTRPPIRLPNPDGPGLVVLSLTETEMAFLKSRCAEAIANALAGSVKLTKPTHRYQKLKHFVEYLFVTNFLTRKDALALPTDDMRRVYRETITAAVSQGVAAFCAGQVENCYAIYLAAAQSLISQSHECTQFCVQEEQCLGEYHPLATVVEKAIAACLQEPNASSAENRSWLLRDCFDFFFYNSLI